MYRILSMWEFFLELFVYVCDVKYLLKYESLCMVVLVELKFYNYEV